MKGNEPIATKTNSSAGQHWEDDYGHISDPLLIEVMRELSYLGGIGAPIYSKTKSKTLGTPTTCNTTQGKGILELANTPMNHR